MAAASTSPPLSASGNADHDEKMALHGRSASSSIIGPTFGRNVITPSPSPSPEAGNARLRDGPVSSVRVGHRDQALPEPSSTNIVNPLSSDVDALATEFSKVSVDLGLPAVSPRTAATKATTTETSSVTGRRDRVSHQNASRSSRESNETTTSTSHQQASAQSSAATSASSVSGIIDCLDCAPMADSPGSFITDGLAPKSASVPPFQYHHQQQQHAQRASIGGAGQFARSPSADLNLENPANIRRHLTPTSPFNQRLSYSPRPLSTYSTLSEYSARCKSPNAMPGGVYMRPPSGQSRNSPDNRHSTYSELLNVPYPQQSPAPLSLDNSNLRTVVGSNASLLSTQKTLDMYRMNVKKTTDFSIQYSFAVFLISTAQERGLDLDSVRESASTASTIKKKKKPSSPMRDLESPDVESPVSTPYDLVREARHILQRLANGGYPFAQYYLADGYASGLFSKGKEDYNSAFPLFVLAAKHGHAESAYRTALCYEFGWGCRKDPAKAVQFLRTAASKRHPGAMTRLGKACLSGDLGEKRYREGLKWLKLATEAADAQYNAAPYQLGCLYETGYGDDIFADESYAAELFTQAADLGHPEANYRMGDAYEHGRLNCPRDPALSVHFYTGAAEKNHAAAMMGLCAWYLVGAQPILDKDEEEAYEWARRSAELGFVKAQYALAYFTEMGIGCRRDILEANVWYVRAADAGDERAKQRLAVIQAAVSGQGTPMEVAPPRVKKGDKDDKDCVVM
ncbi:hypothetical protein E4U34_008100 [Claviceps purpurea]|nr:hypothetical protein E4U34_008100 [Claviceps purpurea]